MISYLKRNRSEIGGRMFLAYRWALFAWIALSISALAYGFADYLFGDYSAGLGMLLAELFGEGWFIWQWAWVLLAQWLITGNRGVKPWQAWPVRVAPQAKEG